VVWQCINCMVSVAATRVLTSARVGGCSSNVLQDYHAQRKMASMHWTTVG
jgi:hypothetical protein